METKKIKYFIGKKVFKNVIWRLSPLDSIKYCNCEAIKLHYQTICNVPHKIWQRHFRLVNKRDMKASDDDIEYDEDYKDKGRLHDALLQKNGMLCQRWVEYKRIVKKLKMELRLSKSHARQTKCWIRIDYDWDGKEANFTNSVLIFVKEYLFPLYKFLKDGWMEYEDGPESLSAFVQGKVNIPEGAEYKDQWERVTYSTIQAKYVTIRCNLNIEIQRTCKSKCIQMRMKFF